MYNFINTTKFQGSAALPSEAVQFNGQWIEEVITGYRTLHVSGRELMEHEIEDMQVGNSDGMRLRNRRLPGRTITVTYQLSSNSNAEFRRAFNKLNQLLDVQVAEMIFNDERDKFFIGTKASVGEVTPGTNNIVGEIEFYCADPCKYSVDEKVVVPTFDAGTTLIVDYTGTRESFPVFEAVMKGDNGFCAFIDDDSNILQFGNVDEVDGVSYEKSETLIRDEMVNGVSGWTVNNGTTVRVTSEHKQTGSMAAIVDTHTKRYMLKSTNYGTGSHWHGPSWTKKVPADSKGHVGAKNCTLSWYHFFTPGRLEETGVVQFLMTDKDKRNVAAMTFFKNTTVAGSGCVELYISGKSRKSIQFDCGYYNNITGWNAGRSSIEKMESKFTFNVAGKVYSFNVPEMQTVEVAEISVYLGVWGTTEQIAINGVYEVRFVSHSVKMWNDIPNKFGIKDVLRADCRSGKVYINGVEMQGLGALGNDWEKFCLKPGTNQIKCTYSGWANAPDFKIKYREVYL